MFYVAIGIPILLLAVWWWRRQHSRAARLRACAEKRGLRFSRRDILDVPRRYGGLAVMRVGHSRRAWDTLFGMHECGAWVGFFDCCEVGFGVDCVALYRCVAAMEMVTGVEALFVPADAASWERDPLRTAMGCLAFYPVRGSEVPGAGSPPAGGGGDNTGEPTAIEGRGDLGAVVQNGAAGGSDSAGGWIPCSHVLHVRRPSAAKSPAVARLATAIARYPKDWSWELGETVIVAARRLPRARPADDTISAMLDAIADVARQLRSERASEPRGQRPGTPG